MSNKEEDFMKIYSEVYNVMNEITKDYEAEFLSGMDLYNETMKILEKYFQYIDSK